MAIYGPSIQSPSLRYAVLSAFEWYLPIKGQPGEHLFSAVDALAKKDLSPLDEGDLFAIAFISYSKGRYTSSYLLPARKAVLDRLPSSSLLLGWFLRTMKAFFDKSAGNFKPYPFSDLWRHAIDLVVRDLPCYFSDESIWELLALYRQYFGIKDINQTVKDIKAFNTAKSFGMNYSDDWYMESAYNNLISRSACIASLGFWTVIQNDLKFAFGRDHRMLRALKDVRVTIGRLEATPIHRYMAFSPPARVTTEDTALGPLVSLCLFRTIDLSLVKLYLALLLDAPTIWDATITRNAIEAAPGIIFLAHFYIQSPLLSVPSALPPFRNAPLHRGSALFVVDTLVASLAHPISHFMEGQILCQRVRDSRELMCSKECDHGGSQAMGFT